MLVCLFHSQITTVRFAVDTFVAAALVHHRARASNITLKQLLAISHHNDNMAQSVGSYSNPLKKFKLVFLGEQSGPSQRIMQ